MELRLGDSHGVEGVDIENVEAAASVHQHLGEVLLADDGVDDERVASRSCDTGGMVPLIKGDRGLRPAEEGGDGRLGGAHLPVAYLMLEFGPDGVRPAEDHDALFRFRETIPILACHATPPNCRLLAVPLLWRAGLSEEMFEELALLVEVFDRIGMIGAWTIHEFVEVVRQSLLGLLGCAISCGDQRGVVRPAPIIPVLFAPLSGGAFI